MHSTRRVFLATGIAAAAATRRTTIAIEKDGFLLNGKPTYKGRTFEGMKIEGLLTNSRMVQGIFDDENPETVVRWRYPDSGKWDPDRNTSEFVAAMPQWRKAGVLSFTICLQGGSPEGYSKSQPWHNSAFRADGSLKPAYMARLKKILDRADALSMVPIVGCFYFGQDQRLEDERAVRQGLDNAVRWLLSNDYKNILLEVANECDNRAYEHAIIKPDRIDELIKQAQSITHQGHRLLAGTSFNGGRVPTANVVKVSDFVLIHGNGVTNPNRIREMVDQTRALPTYRPMPILFNEDDHFDFEKPSNNMRKSLEAYASWGYFDPGENNYISGYQCPPVQWRINTTRKKEFFAFSTRVTGGG